MSFVLLIALIEFSSSNALGGVSYPFVGRGGQGFGFHSAFNPFKDLLKTLSF